jgi:hypothetical protein
VLSVVSAHTATADFLFPVNLYGLLVIENARGGIDTIFLDIISSKMNFMATHVCRYITVGVFLGSVLLASEGCGQTRTRSFHEKFNWRAEDYFDDAKVIELCKAIQTNDVPEVERIIKAGADVNAKGKGGMTPLLWAFPDNKPEAFKCLLEHGADPNVIVDSDFNTKGAGILPGDSVTHMAARTYFPTQFELVMKHEGDPNLVNSRSKATTIREVIMSGTADKRSRVQLLIDKGVDLNQLDGSFTPAMRAVSWFSQWDLALMILEAGADPDVYKEESNSKLVHTIVRFQDSLAQATPTQKAAHKKLVDWLESHGQSMKQAEADLQRWDSLRASKPLSEYGKIMRAEVEQRKAAEKMRSATGIKGH